MYWKETDRVEYTFFQCQKWEDERRPVDGSIRFQVTKEHIIVNHDIKRENTAQNARILKENEVKR